MYKKSLQATATFLKHLLAIAPAWAPELACEIRQPLGSKSRLRQLIICKHLRGLFWPSIGG